MSINVLAQVRRLSSSGHYAVHLAQARSSPIGSDELHPVDSARDGSRDATYFPALEDAEVTEVESGDLITIEVVLPENREAGNRSEVLDWSGAAEEE